MSVPTAVHPVPGCWYQHLDKGQEFQVIDVDETAAMVATQHFDGDLEAISLDDWYELDIEAIEAPEDCTGPMDDIEPDDLGYSDTAMDAADWSAPLEELKSDADGAGAAEPEADDAAESAQEAGIELVPYRE
jgi:hypothetical protein